MEEGDSCRVLTVKRYNLRDLVDKHPGSESVVVQRVRIRSSRMLATGPAVQDRMPAVSGGGRKQVNLCFCSCIGDRTESL